MPTKPEILDAALLALRAGEPLTLDAVARRAGLTKPGVVHHFPTKQALTIAVVDHVIDAWETQLRERAPDDADDAARLRAYLDWVLLGDLTASDLAFLADARLRDRLAVQWTRRLRPWLGTAFDSPAVKAARLIADGAWFDRSLGIVELSRAEREAILAVALGLVDGGRGHEGGESR